MYNAHTPHHPHRHNSLTGAAAADTVFASMYVTTGEGEYGFG
jgi:hypothetical protein